MICLRIIALFLLVLGGLTPESVAGPKGKKSKVTFDATGTSMINGRPFFPIGIFTYSVDSSIMAEIKKQQFNTIIALTEHHKPNQLDFFLTNGMMTVAPARTNWLAAGVQHHPGLLAWYLEDEPEGHGRSPEAIIDKYRELKKTDPNHPIGLCHFLWEAIAQYKDAADFTMTSVYPLTANRDTPITHVGKFMDHSRSVHGQFWPHWPYIQIFGGPDTDGGKWRQPTPEEVRCMVYLGLVHRANGILYFSYWPKAAETWQSVGLLNGEIKKMTPWLVTRGAELVARSTNPDVRVRARRTAPDGTSGLLIFVNTTEKPVETEISIPGIQNRDVHLRQMFGNRSLSLEGGLFTERLEAYGTRVYFWGQEPKMNLAVIK